MNFRTVKQPAALAVAAVLCAAILAPQPALAETVSTNAASDEAAGWLAGQLTGGLAVTNSEFGEFTDYGLSIDVLFALQETEAESATQDAIVDALSADVTEYIRATWMPEPESTLIVGSAAKLTVGVQSAGADPSNFGGENLIAEIEGSLRDDGAVQNKDAGFDSNMFGQAFALQGLAEASSAEVGDVRDFLLSEQCADGNIPLNFGDCGQNVDSTAIAIDAMVAARNDGVGGMDAAIGSARDWLLSQQDPDGSFVDGGPDGAPNANSTGRAAYTLASLGQTNAARKAAGWVFDIQVSEANEGPNLEGERGAIAIGPDQFVSGQDNGIADFERGTWLRATAQGALALTSVLYVVVEKTVERTVEKTVEKVVEKRVEVPKPVERLEGGDEAAKVARADDVVVNDGAEIADEAETPPGRLGQFLAAQLSNGDHVEVKVGDEEFTDYDLTADTALALRLLGEQSKFAERITTFMLDDSSVEAFAFGAPYEDEAVYAEPLAKLIIAASTVEKPDTARIGSLAEELMALQNDDGAFEDQGEFADKSRSASRHAQATLALLMAGEVRAAEQGVAHLGASQCDDGGFPASLGQDCGVGDPAATGWGLQAFNALDRDARTDDALIAELPDGWDGDRARNIESAVASLHESLNVSGAISDEDGVMSPASTSVVAAGRQAVGLDTTAAATVLAGTQVEDGGMPDEPNGKDGNLAVTTASAPGIAGSSWLSRPRTGLTNGVAMPLVDLESSSSPAAPASDGFEVSRPVAYAVLGALVMFAAMSVALMIGLLSRRKDVIA